MPKIDTKSMRLTHTYNNSDLDKENHLIVVSICIVQTYMYMCVTNVIKLPA